MCATRRITSLSSSTGIIRRKHRFPSSWKHEEIAAFCNGLSRWHLAPLMLVILGLSVSVSAAEAAPMRLLIVWQGPDGHPPTTHEFQAGAKVLAELLKPHKDVQVTLANADEPWTDGPTIIDQSDGIVMFVTQGAGWA